MLNHITLYTIQPANNDDITSVKSVISMVRKEYKFNGDQIDSDEDLNNIEDCYFNSKGYFGLVININGKVVGTFGLYRVSYRVGELRNMFLLKEAREIGCSEMIMDFVIDLALRYRFHVLKFNTSRSMRGTVSLCEKYGFIEVKPNKDNPTVDRVFELMVNGLNVNGVKYVKSRRAIFTSISQN